MTVNCLALGLGEMHVRSFLGQNLVVYSDLVGVEDESLVSACIKARVLSMEGNLLSSVNITQKRIQGRRVLQFASKLRIQEPAVRLLIDVACDTQLHRDFSILLDPIDNAAEVSADWQDDKNSGNIVELAAPAAANIAKANAVSDRDAIALTVPEKKQKKKVNATLGVNAERFDAARLPSVEAESKLTKPTAKKKQNLNRDVLRLSEDIAPVVQEHGLRMSEILSTESGQRLVANMQELKAAQARMAALLRDEPAHTESGASIQEAQSPAPQLKTQDSEEITRLKAETAQLRKQSLADKTIVEDLKKRSQFDYWIMVLAVVAIIAVALIAFLLIYIRRGMQPQAQSWWEGEETAAPDEDLLEDMIDSVQASYELNPIGAPRRRKADDGREQAETPQNPDQFSSLPTSGEEASSQMDGDGRQKSPTLEETNSSIFNFFLPRSSAVKVEEISDVTQEAEFWISMNDPLRAIEILAAQEDSEHPDSPVPWLYLLDLYRMVDDGVKYEHLRARFVACFNARIPEFDEDMANWPRQDLEQFGHVLDRICVLWGSAEACHYLSSLLVDDRHGERTGFDLAVYRDILMLLGIAKELDRQRLSSDGINLNAAPNYHPEPKEKETIAMLDPLADATFSSLEVDVIDFTQSRPRA